MNKDIFQEVFNRYGKMTIPTVAWGEVELNKMGFWKNLQITFRRTFMTKKQFNYYLFQIMDDLSLCAVLRKQQFQGKDYVTLDQVKDNLNHILKCERLEPIKYFDEK